MNRITPLPDDVPAMREAVNASIATDGLRPTARIIGLSPTGLSKFATERSVYPYAPTLRRLRKWYQKHASMENKG